jgi:predicted ferric reductase
LEFRKKALLALMLVTSLAPLGFVQFDEPNVKSQVYKGLAKTGALCGTLLLSWQFVLGFRQVSGKILPDLLWVLSLHKAIGKYILFLVSFHLVFITLYYIDRKEFNPLVLQGGFPFAAYVFLGEIAFALFVVVVITSVFFRSRMSRKMWYIFHLVSYLALPVVFIHSFPIGMTIGESGLWVIWNIVMIGLMIFYIFRGICWLGVLSHEHIVTSVEDVGPRVVKISALPVRKKVEPKLGQFIYFGLGRWGPSRPFTVSHYRSDSGEISVTVKAFGEGTRKLQAVRPGQNVYIDGPYGVFANAVLHDDRPLVMIAGGIGITPFKRIFEELAYQPDREIHLFYGNKRRNEIVYEEELNNVETVTVVHVLSHEPDYPGEKGFITVDLMKKYLSRSLQRYDFLICGPPAMTAKLEEDLTNAAVPAGQIYHELFSY